ncbi:MAG: hypothetical protein ACTSPI_09370 [Candidatus Heimdallarchaeaceae archaeon]
MKTMEIAAKLLFRSLSSIYGGTISSGALHPNKYFKDNGKTSIFYGIRLHDLLSTRLIAHIYSEGKTIYVDLLWLVDNLNVYGSDCISFRKEKKSLLLAASSSHFKEIVEKDATIQACYPDLLNDYDIFNLALVGSKSCYFKKMIDKFGLIVDNIPTEFFAVSRCCLNRKKTNNKQYSDAVINCFIALTDLIHRSLELNSSSSEPISVTTQYCIRCGYALAESSYFCPFCGAKQD